MHYAHSTTDLSLATSSVTYGCSLYYIRLQPTLHTVAAYITYGCSLHYIRLQPVRLSVATSSGSTPPSFLSRVIT